MPHVSIIIVHFNDQKTTFNCLNSLTKLKKPVGFKFNVIIVDNGSQKLLKLPARFSLEKFILIRSDANLGFTGGNNMGIHQAIESFNSQFIWLVNNDTTFDSHCLSQLLEAAELHPEWGMISPKIYFSPGKEFHKQDYAVQARGKVLWFAGGVIDWSHLTAFHKGVDEVDRGQFDEQIATDFCTGCSVFIRREVLEKIGFLDKRYFLYFEDVDWSLRAIKAGYKLAFWPKAIMWHDNAGSSGGSGSHLQVYYQERNRSLLAWLYGDFPAKIVALRLQYANLISQKAWKRKAVIDFYKRKFGKQMII